DMDLRCAGLEHLHDFFLTAELCARIELDANASAALALDVLLEIGHGVDGRITGIEDIRHDDFIGLRLRHSRLVEPRRNQHEDKDCRYCGEHEHDREDITAVAGHSYHGVPP